MTPKAGDRLVGKRTRQGLKSGVRSTIGGVIGCRKGQVGGNVDVNVCVVVCVGYLEEGGRSFEGSSEGHDGARNEFNHRKASLWPSDSLVNVNVNVKVKVKVNANVNWSIGKAKQSM